MGESFKHVALSIALAFALSTASAAQETAGALLAEAETLYQGGAAPSDDLTQVRAILDRIVAEHPTSDQAIGVLLGEQVGSIDVAELDALIAGGGNDVASDAPLGEETVAEDAPIPSPGSSEMEQALALSKQDIRDIQARLLVLGFDPNGIDAVIGRGTRAALSAWQAEQGIVANGYLSAEQRARLQVQSDGLLAAWRVDPENEALYQPPPPIALGPSNLTGAWRFTTTCGRNSKIGSMKINGVLNVGHTGGNRYAGPVRQSQGFRGQFSGRLEGRQMSGVINWGLLLGRVQVVGAIAEQSLTMSGRDSNRCRFFARKS